MEESTRSDSLYGMSGTGHTNQPARMRNVARAEKLLDVPLAIATLAVAPALLFLIAAHGTALEPVAIVIDGLIWLAFLTEVAIVMVLSHNRRRWLVEHPLEIMIVVLTPPMMPPAFHLLRLMRLLRVLRLLVESHRFSRLFTMVGLQYVWMLSALLVAATGLVFSTVEPSVASTWRDGLWWALVTASTVGYGDMVPATDGGRTLAAIAIFVGVGAVSITTAAIARRFIDEDIEQGLEGEVEHDLAAMLDDRIAALERAMIQHLDSAIAAISSDRPPDPDDLGSSPEGLPNK